MHLYALLKQLKVQLYSPGGAKPKFACKSATTMEWYIPLYRMTELSQQREQSKTYICDNLCLAVLNVIEQLTLFQLNDCLLPIVTFLLQT